MVMNTMRPYRSLLAATRNMYPSTKGIPASVNDKRAPRYSRFSKYAFNKDSVRSSGGCIGKFSYEWSLGGGIRRESMRRVELVACKHSHDGRESDDLHFRLPELMVSVGQKKLGK